ncbi:MAG: hypothetical protein AB8H86_18540 [Polyangiales bacterium]
MSAPDEFELEQAAIEAKRNLGLLCLGSAALTFVFVAFLGEFLLATPMRFSNFELTKGHAYLLAPVMAMLVAGFLYRLKRPATRSFLDIERASLVDAGAEGSVDPEDARLFADARKRMRAKMSAGVAALSTLLFGYLAVQAYYDYRNELPTDAYAPRLRLQIGESAAILLVALLLAFALYRALAPALAKENAERAHLDDDTKDLYAGVVRGSRKAKLAMLVGVGVGLGAAVLAFNLLIWQLEPQSIMDLRLLMGTVMAGVLVGGAARKALLPDSMRDEEALDLAALPAGTPARLVASMQTGFTLARQPSILDTLGLESRQPARYELLSGDSIEGIVAEEQGRVGAALLGGERAMSLIVSDIEARCLTIQKPVFGSQLLVQDADSKSIARVRRSRVPFVKTLVVEALGGNPGAAPGPVRLSKRWFSKHYVARRDGGDIADVRVVIEKNAGDLPVRKLHVRMAEGRDEALWLLAGVLAMDLT